VIEIVVYNKLVAGIPILDVDCHSTDGERMVSTHTGLGYIVISRLLVDSVKHMLLLHTPMASFCVHRRVRFGSA